MRQLRTWKAFLAPKMPHAVEFLFSQGITMAGTLLYGLLCVRLLPVNDYAKYVVVYAIQGSLVVLMDVGITGSIIPLLGEQIDNRQLIADYVASLRHLAYWLFAIMAPITIVVYPLLVRNRHWSWQVVTAMVAILLVSVWFVRVSSAYGAVLIVRRDRRRWYRAQMVSSLGTLALLGVFFALHWLNAFSAILINLLGLISIAAAYFFRARQLLGVTGVPSREKRKAIIQLALPSAPGAIFYALQGQLAVLLITILGRTEGVASVGALGRLGQIFALVSQMNPILVEPYFARLPKARLKADYLRAVALVGGFGLCIVFLARTFPEVFLWVLGPQYSHLRFEVLQVMLAGAIGLQCGLMASINGARRFVYYWQNVSNIGLTILVQIIFLWKADLSSIRGVLWLNIASSLPALALGIVVAFYGFARGGRKIVGLEHLPEGS